MQRNEMGGVGVHHVAWDEDFFEKAFVQAWQCIQAVTAHQKPLVRFREITDSLPINTKSIYEKFQQDEVVDNIVYVISFWWRGEG